MARRANLTLTLSPGQPIETAAAKFKKKCIAMGLGKEAKRHAFYEKPSVRKRRKAAAARKRFRKDHAANGEPLFQIERERQRYGD